MIPNETVVAERSGTVDNSTRIRFEVSVDNAHVMKMLSGQYARVDEAVAREYTNNAWDSHIKAGNTEPILITLPDTFNSTLVIQDFGTGLSADEIRNEYGKYGSSTSRGHAEATGMLGIGGKVWAAYCDQCTLETVKDGRKAQVLMAKDPDGVGTLQIIDERDTDEPNGVTILIPVSDTEAMTQAVRRIARYWPRGTMLINGEEPYNVWDDPASVVLDPDVVLVPGSGQSKLVMGNVAYPAPLSVGNNWSAVARCEVGSFNPAPSREAAQESPELRETLRYARRFIDDTYARQIQAKIDAFDMPVEAVKFRATLSGMERRWTWRGTPIPYYVKLDGYNWQSYYDRKAQKLGKTGSLFDIARAELVVVGSNRIGSNMKRKAHKFLDDTGRQQGTIYFVAKNPAPLWLDETKVISIEQIRAVKVPDLGRSGTRKCGVRLVNRNGDLDYVDELPDEARLVTTFSSTPNYQRNVLGSLATHLDDVKVVSVRKGSEAKFARDNPEALSIGEFLDLAIEEITLTLDDEAYWIATNGGRMVISPNASKVEDPELAKYLEIKARPVRSGAYRALGDALSTFRHPRTLPSLDVVDVRNLHNTLTDRYPFLFSHYQNPDPTWLVNAWFNKDNDTDKEDDND